MTYTEMKKYVEHMNDNNLIDLCRDIYNWKYVSGELQKDCTLKNLAEDLRCNINELEGIIIEVAAKKLHKVVCLLLLNAPHEFLKA